MKQIKIFLGGGVALLEGDNNNVGYRPSVVDPVISKLNSRKDAQRFYIVKTFTDFKHEYTPEGLQEHYHRYIENEADIAIFIFDGRIGNITEGEVERACNSNKMRHRPTVFFYGTNLSDDDDIVTYLSSKKQYFQHFKNKEQLLRLITEDLNQWKGNTHSTLLWILVALCIAFFSIVVIALYMKLRPLSDEEHQASATEITTEEITNMPTKTQVSQMSDTHVVIAGDNVCLRRYPSEDSKMAGPSAPHLFTGETYTCRGRKGNYYEIEYKGEVLYLPQEYGRIRGKNVSDSSNLNNTIGKIVIAGDNVCPRTQPSEDSKITNPTAPRFFTGETYSCIGKTGNYYKITYHNTIYYIPQQYCRER